MGVTLPRPLRPHPPRRIHLPRPRYHRTPAPHSLLARHSEGARRPKNPPVGSARETTRFLQLCCHSRAPLPTPRTRTQRSGSRPKRRSKGAGEAFAARRKRSPADFATTQSPGTSLKSNDVYCLTPGGGDPRFARMTVVVVTPPASTVSYCPAPDWGIPRPSASE